MGNNYVGVQAAAMNYFGKDASELTLPECALIAGLPKSPSYYNPLRETGRRNAQRRMRTILGKMFELGMITEEDKQIQKLQTKIDQMETSLDEERREHDRDVTELRNRLATLEKKPPKEASKEKKKAGSIIRDATWLVAIAAGAWVIVTIINKFSE
jgi:membrane peptidoglycan carboxypeptidase